MHGDQQHGAAAPLHRSSSPLLPTLWLASVGGMVTPLEFGAARIIGAVAGLLFILSLTQQLIQRAPHASDLPSLPSGTGPLQGFWSRTAVVALALFSVLGLGLVVSPGASLLTTGGVIGLGIMVAWWRQLRAPVVATGLTAGGAVALGIILLEGGEPAWAALNALALPPAFIAGALLCERSGLGQVRLLNGQPWLSLRGAAWGCVLALPAALFNLLGNLQAGDVWVQHWWQPLAALNPALGEEIWARLLLTTLVYAVLRPTTNERPQRALAAAVLLGASAHALAHTGINPIGLVVGTLLYGVPCGLLFVKRDLEHAIGYHFCIDLVRYGAALMR